MPQREQPRLRRTPQDPWLSSRMRHSAELGQRQLALTDGLSAALGSALARLRALVLPTPDARPMLPDPAQAQNVFDAACAEFVQPLVGERWWAQHGPQFVGGFLPDVLNGLQQALAQAASDPSVSVEQERAAALGMLHLAGGSLPALTAAGPPDDVPAWSARWNQAWSAWDAVASLDDDAAVARGHRRVAEALTDRLKKTEDKGVQKALAKLIADRLGAAARVNPAAAKLTAAIDRFTSATNVLGVARAPFPGLPNQPLSTAPTGQKNYYAKAERKARSGTVSSYNQDALDRARQSEADGGVRMVKTWLATVDARTRDDHEEADGQQVPLDEPFIVGGEELAYPGDPDGPDDQVINCRCTFITEYATDSADNDSGSTLPIALIAAQEAPMEPDELPTGWEGVLCPLNTLSGDGREIAEPTTLRLRQAPIPFSHQVMSAPEHDNSVLVGRIDEAWIEGGMLRGRGTYDLGSEYGREAARQLGAGFASRVSVDLDDVTAEFREAEPTEPTGDEMDDLFMMPEGTFVMTDWRLAGATQVTISAFDEAIISPVYASAEAPAPVPEEAAAALTFELAVGDTVELTDPDGGGLVQGTISTINDDDTVTVSVPTDGGDARLITVPVADVTVVTPEEVAALVASLVAPLTPPRAWYANPSYGLGGEDVRLQPLLGQPGAYGAPLTIDDDGRVSGHIATWGTCHTGMPGCTTPPSSRSGYAGFLLGETVTDQGRIATGTLTFDTGHADIKLDAMSAVRHYDNTGTGFATVNIGEDIHGIWVAGALLPDVKPELLPRLRAAKPSGDWRGGELRAVLHVNTAGFPVMRSRSNDLNSAPLALVASGVPQYVPLRRQHFPITPRMVSMLAKELERREERRQTAAALGRSMNKIKAQRLAARVSRTPEA